MKKITTAESTSSSALAMDTTQIVVRMGKSYFLLPTALNGTDPELAINSNFNCDIK